VKLAHRVELAQVRGRDDPRLGDIVRIADEMLGAGIYDALVLRLVAELASATLLAAVAEDGVVGWGFGEELSGDRSWYAQFGAQALACAARPRVVSVRELAVLEAYQGRGVGRALTEAVLAWARGRGAEHAIAVSWLSPAPRTSAPLFERLGFVRLGVAAAPYEEDSRARGWRCRYCGGVCLCPAAFYALALTA